MDDLAQIPLLTPCEPLPLVAEVWSKEPMVVAGGGGDVEGLDLEQVRLVWV